MSETTTPTPNRPDARTIRRHLKACGLEHLVERVTSGRSDCHVTIALPADASYHALGDNDRDAQLVAKALRLLWSDGDHRVRVLYSGKVLVRRAGWYAVTPADSETVTTKRGRVAVLASRGWDGQSQPIVRAVELCGCEWTRDGQALLSSCTGCLREACRRQALELAKHDNTDRYRAELDARRAARI